MSYIGNEPIVSATRTITEISATSGQTVFVANGGYAVGKIDVFVNGSQLQTTDFTASNGSSVTLNTACAVGDDVRLVAWGTFSFGNVTPAALSTGGPYWDTSGNVGLGTTSPGANSKLDVIGNISLDSAFSSQYGICFRRGFETSDNLRIYAGDTGMSRTGGLRVAAYDGFAVGTGSNTWQERMRVDYYGRVTKPYQPAFLASGNGGFQTPAGNTVLPFNILPSAFSSSNRNSGFNTSTYLYTAPVAGLYQFYCQIYSNATNATSLAWRKNGAEISFQDTALIGYCGINLSSTGLTVNGSVLLELAAGDSVGVATRSGSSSQYIYMGHSCFYGHLIG